MKYGKIIPDLKIDGVPAPYPVINEREVRGTAGIMFLIGIVTFFIVFYTKNYSILYFVVSLFWLEFFLKTVFQPHYSVFGFIASFVVRKQRPEYVGVIQKRFAWGIGLALASIMIVVSMFFGIRGWIPFSICMICLLFMWIESVFGICVGCKIYSFFIKKGLIKKPEYKPACPGGVCNIE